MTGTCQRPVVAKSAASLAPRVVSSHLISSHLLLIPHNHTDCHCLISSSLPNSPFLPPVFSDPAVSRYHVQWMPEYCSHNETRGPEKSVTQVRLRPPSLSNLPAGASGTFFCPDAGKSRALLKKTAPGAELLIAGCCSECYDSAVRSGMWCVGTIKRHLL